MTPLEFENNVKTIFITHCDDEEKCHMELDSLYERTLDQIGFDIGLVDELKEKYNCQFWYG